VVEEEWVIRWLGIVLCALALNAQDVRLQVITTTDVHGAILPQDSFTLQPANQGWARLATLIRGLRADNPNTVLVDCGDATQGEPINYVWSQLNSKLPEPSTAIMNALGYNAMVVGGQEFDRGMKMMRAMEDQAQFPWLAANVVFAADGHRVFTPYVKVAVAGVQVAILGLAAVPPRPDGADGLVFQDPVATAKALIPLLRGQEKADMVIVALHGGLGKEPCADLQNQALCLAAQVPGIDLILAGRSRQLVSTEAHGVPILQAGSKGQALGVGDFLFHRGRTGWALQSHSVRILPAGAETAADPGVLELTAPLRAATETYLDTFATTLGTDLDGRWSRMEDTALMHLLHTVARQASGAQITALASPGARIFIPRGATSVRQFYALCADDERIDRITVSGRQLKAYLEHAASFYNFSHNPELFAKGAGPGDFDTLEGCAYTLDISRPVGMRVVDLKIQGQPVREDQSFTLGLLSRRLAGAGGYLQAMGWSGQPAFQSAAPFRNFLLEYVLSRPNLALEAEDNWHIVPSLDRERVLAQQP
jgi:2',3'-cyclic-nucleotide 2'-phosphodiesterase/3'-nucleotidase